ncbi:MAG: class I SAM-dependent methyltransferase, partial [Desulfobacteraceae bacterium]|nr:class I SAM-dependent methyltransferase [Desulfobacteraceae bacterium]
MKNGRLISQTIAALLITLCILSGVKAQQSTQEKTAQKILDAAGIKGGLVVHIGCGDGKLTAALRANESYMVHGLDRSVKNIERARKHIQLLKLYGKVSVEQLKGNRLPYVDNLVNLV